MIPEWYADDDWAERATRGWRRHLEAICHHVGHRPRTFRLYGLPDSRICRRCRAPLTGPAIRSLRGQR